MEFSEFTDILEKNVSALVKDRLPGAKVQREKVNKLQGKSYIALMVTPGGGNVGVNINTSEAYDRLKEGCDMDRLAAEAVDMVLSRLSNLPDIDVRILDDYEIAKTRLFPQIIAVDGNEDMLKVLPHRIIEDLAVVYRLNVYERRGMEETALVGKKLMDIFGVDQETLDRDAFKNAEVMRPVVISNVRDEIRKFSGDTGAAEMYDMPDTGLYYVGTKSKLFGASAVFYEGVMEKCAEILGGNYYILPSSIHEMLLIRDSNILDPVRLAEMITQINTMAVDPADRLTNHAYYYDENIREFSSAGRLAAYSH